MSDTDQAALAAYLDERLPGWLVVWSPWRRRFTAIAACTPYSLIIDERDPDRLLDRARAAQLAAATPGHRPPPAPEGRAAPSPVTGDRLVAGFRRS